MKVNYLATLAAIAVLSTGAATVATHPQAALKVVSAALESKAMANPCAGKPNPCASKSNPCAAKKNPCAGKVSKTTVHPAYYSENGVALDGQDVVSYFTENKPVTGNKKFSYQWKGADWQFSSAANRDLFAKNPEKYAPAYGGYCAKAASDGNLATTVPTAWEIRNGKLILNYSAEAQKEWLQDTPKKVIQANKNFPKILNNETLYR